MGYTIYYRVSFNDRDKALKILRPILEELNFRVYEENAEIIIEPDCERVEPMIINGRWMSAKTYKLQPYTGIYKLLLLSLSSFASVEAFDDEDWSLK